MAVRYFVADVERSLAFFEGSLGFLKVERWGPAFAIVEKDDQKIWLSGPGTSAMKALLDGSTPRPGGSTRIVVETLDLVEMVEELRAQGTTFLGELVTGPGGSQIVIADPDGNPIELFEGR